MKTSQLVGRAAIVIGLVILAVEVVQRSPWQLAVAIAILFVFFGAIVALDTSDVEPSPLDPELRERVPPPVPMPDMEGGEVRSLPRRPGA